MNSLMGGITPGELAAMGAERKLESLERAVCGMMVLLQNLEKRVSELEEHTAYLERKCLKHFPEDRDTPSPYDLGARPKRRRP